MSPPGRPKGEYRSAQHEGTPVSVSGRRPRLLLVDDDASLRRLVELALEDLDLELLGCASVAAAREHLRQAPVDLLITDLMMPGESGLDLLRELAADATRLGTARRVVFSAGLNASLQDELAGLGVWRQLHKPVPLSVLEDCVREALAAPAAAAPDAASAVAGSAAVADVVHRLFGGDRRLYDDFRRQAVQQFADDLQAGDRALDGADWTALRHLAHGLKSVWRLLGDGQAEALAEQLETEAAAGDALACAGLWPRLRQCLLRSGATGAAG